MRWFSHRRSLWPRAVTQWYRLLLLAAYRLLSIATGIWLSSFSIFVPDNLDFWPLTLIFELGRDFCTLYLTTKFDLPTFSRSEVMRTNKHTDKQTPLKTSTALRYATSVGKIFVNLTLLKFEINTKLENIPPPEKKHWSQCRRGRDGGAFHVLLT